MKRRPAGRAIDAEQMLRHLSSSPGYLVKVPCTHEQFLQIGKVVSAWDSGREHVRVCVYVGVTEAVAVVSLRSSATESTVAALQALLSRWGPSTVAVVTEGGSNPLTA